MSDDDRGAVDRSDARDVDVEHLLADALDRDVEVALERAFHCVLERERYARSARVCGLHGQRAQVPGRRAAWPAAKRFGGSFNRLCAEAGTAATSVTSAQESMSFI